MSANDELPDDPSIVQRHWHDRSQSELVTLSTALSCLSGHLGYQNFVATGSGSSPNCLYTVNPEDMAAFGKVMRLRDEAVRAALDQCTYCSDPAVGLDWHSEPACAKHLAPPVVANVASVSPVM